MIAGRGRSRRYPVVPTESSNDNRDHHNTPNNCGILRDGGPHIPFRIKSGKSMGWGGQHRVRVQDLV